MVRGNSRTVGLLTEVSTRTLCVFQRNFKLQASSFNCSTASTPSRTASARLLTGIHRYLQFHTPFQLNTKPPGFLSEPSRLQQRDRRRPAVRRCRCSLSVLGLLSPSIPCFVLKSASVRCHPGPNKLKRILCQLQAAALHRGTIPSRL
jgi:hypothetical protein